MSNIINEYEEKWFSVNFEKFNHLARVKKFSGYLKNVHPQEVSRDFQKVLNFFLKNSIFFVFLKDKMLYLFNISFK